MITNRTIDNEALYLQAIRAAYPDLDIHTARLNTGVGQFNDVVFINDDLIFRFDGNRIRGIIDFSFAGLDDPARDIAAVSTYGEAFFARIRRHYPDIDPLLECAKFYKGTFALQEALHGFRNHDREAFESGMEDYV